jgi:hypothetical protein
MRDEFPASVRRILGMRVGYRCSHPECGVATIGAGSGTAGVVSVGVAAHIAAASPGGPRYDPSKTSAERASVENGIWLCQIHAREIDVDPEAYSGDLLRSWKRRAEAEARRLTGSIGSAASTGQAPLHVPKLPVTTRTSLSFASRSTPFLGREAEWSTLSRFLERDKPFLWTSVSGPAGSGKSRLLLEFSIAARPVWLGGFVDFMGPDFDWQRWVPTEHNLIILDYASTFSDQVRNLFAAFEKLSGNDARIRVILSDRSDATTLRRRLFTGSDADRFLQYVDDAPIELSPLTQDQVRELTAVILGDAFQKSAENQLILPPESRHPLFAAIAAHMRAEGDGPTALDRVSLVRSWLDREKRKYWKPAGVTKSEIRLACLMSIGGPMVADVALSGALADCGINLDEVEVQRYGALTGVTPLDRFEPLAPDILGEYLVLDTLQDQNPANALSKSLLQNAWIHSAESTAGFLLRAAEDFPDHPVVIKVIAFVPEDAPSNAVPPTPGRPTLPTMWAEAVPQLPVVILYHKHGSAIFDVILTACRTKPDHEVLTDLRRYFGDQLFDDPLCINALVMFSVSSPQLWDFTESSELALRFSDMRWRLALLIDNLLRNLTGFDDIIIDKIVEASDLLLCGGKGDRRIRRVLFAAILEGITDRFAAGDITRARKLWRQMIETFEWWLTNPDKRAIEYTRSRAEPVQSDEPPAPPPDEPLRSVPQEFAADQIAIEARVYTFFNSGEDTTDAAFIDMFGKTASNYILLELKRRTVELSYAQETLERLLGACNELEGLYDLPGRVMEASAYLVEYHIRAGEIVTADRLLLEAQGIALRCREAGRTVAPGFAFVLIYKINGFIAAGDLAAADAAFSSGAPEIGIPGNVTPSEFKAISAALGNLASMHGAKGDLSAMARYKSILDQISDTTPGAMAALLETRIALRRNELVMSVRDGRPQEVVPILSSIADLARFVNAPQEAVFALGAAETALANEAPTSEAVGQVVAEIVERTCERALHFEFGQVHSMIIGMCHKLVLKLVRSEKDAAERVVNAASDLATAQFKNGDEVAEMLRGALVITAPATTMKP